jgi:hypothetical protein
MVLNFKTAQVLPYRHQFCCAPRSSSRRGGSRKLLHCSRGPLLALRWHNLPCALRQLLSEKADLGDARRTHGMRLMCPWATSGAGPAAPSGLRAGPSAASTGLGWKWPPRSLEVPIMLILGTKALHGATKPDAHGTARTIRHPGSIARSALAISASSTANSGSGVCRRERKAGRSCRTRPYGRALRGARRPSGGRRAGAHGRTCSKMGFRRKQAPLAAAPVARQTGEGARCPLTDTNSCL